MSDLSPSAIYFNGKIVTVDARFSICSAMATRGERIVAIGDDAEVTRMAGPQTQCINLGGKTVIPGLIDAHAHMDREGLKSVYPSLQGLRSVGAILRCIETLSKAANPGDWIVTMPIGDPPSYFDVPETLVERRWPTRWELDEVAPKNPVYIRPIWGYWRHRPPLVSIANSQALEICRIDRNTPPPVETIVIEKDAAGEPTGLFIESTDISIVELTLLRAAGGFTLQDRIDGLARSMKIYNSFGTTSVFEGHGVAGEVQMAYKHLFERGQSTVRANLLFSPSWSAAGKTNAPALMQCWAAWLGGRGMGDNVLRIGGLYALLESETPRAIVESALRASAGSYTGWAGFYYDAALPRDLLKSVLIEAAQKNIRCCGLAINLDLLDLFEEVDRVVPIRDQRWVLEHLNLMNRDQIARVRDLGLVVTTHTNRIWKMGTRLQDSVGTDRASEISPLANLRDSGVRFCLASDNAPVSLFNPIWQSVARKDRSSDMVIAPDQRISREDALRAATINGAYLTLEEDDKGSIEVNKLADFVCLSADPLTVNEDAIKDICAEFTVVGGRRVYTAKP